MISPVPRSSPSNKPSEVEDAFHSVAMSSRLSSPLLGVWRSRADAPRLLTVFCATGLRPSISALIPNLRTTLRCFNCPDAHERIRYYPELATMSLQIAREESTHAYREGSEAIQYPRPRSHSGIVQPQRWVESAWSNAIFPHSVYYQATFAEKVIWRTFAGVTFGSPNPVLEAWRPALSK